MAKPSNKTVQSDTEVQLSETNENTSMKQIEVFYNAPETKRVNENDVLFKIEYSEKFKGHKYFKDGSETIISKETADLFIKLGIGKIVK